VDELGFAQSLTDLCIFFKHEESEHLAIVILAHVDDSLIGGWKHRLEEFFRDRKTGKTKETLGSIVDLADRLEQQRSLSMHLNAKDGARNKEAYVHTTRKNAKEAKTPAYPSTCLHQSGQLRGEKNIFYIRFSRLTL